MAASVVGHVTARDPAKWATYVGAVGGTLAPFGGAVVFRGRKASVLAGEHRHDLAVVLRFPDHEAALAWHISPAYQALIPNRDAAAELVLVGCEGVG